MPAISVIIPAYNVEKYIARCLDSICSQSCHDLEIIVIDDGSYDKTSEICDKYAAVDGRVKVVHKRNEGVAAARNNALDLSSGDMIAFADADDYYEPDMLKKLSEALKIYDADMAVCGYYEEHPDRIDEMGIGKGTLVYDKLEAYKDYFTMGGRIGSGCWNKLIRKEAVGNSRFKNYSKGEDVEWISRVLDNCNKVVTLDYAGYHYIHRNDSATRRGFERSNLDVLKASDEMVLYVKHSHPELLKHMYAFQAAWYSAQIQWMYWFGDIQRYAEENRYIRRGIKENIRHYANNPYIVRADRLYIYSYMLGCYRPVKKIYDMLSSLKKKLSAHASSNR